MPDAQLILVKGTSPIAWLIQRATGSPYSHVGFLIDGMTYEQDLGFVSRPIDEYGWPYDLFSIEGMTPEKSEALRVWCLANRHTPYDYGKVLGMGLDTLLVLKHLVGWRSLLDSKAAMNCAEWCWQGMCSQGISCARPLATITPLEISQDPAVKFVRSYAARERWAA